MGTRTPLRTRRPSRRHVRRGAAERARSVRAREPGDPIARRAPLGLPTRAARNVRPVTAATGRKPAAVGPACPAPSRSADALEP